MASCFWVDATLECENSQSKIIQMIIYEHFLKTLTSHYFSRSNLSHVLHRHSLEIIENLCVWKIVEHFQALSNHLKKSFFILIN